MGSEDPATAWRNKICISPCLFLEPRIHGGARDHMFGYLVILFGFERFIGPQACVLWFLNFLYFPTSRLDWPGVSLESIWAGRLRWLPDALGLIKMVTRAAPEWTIVDFIHQGYWWKNRGTYLYIVTCYCVLSRHKGILLLNLCLLLPLLTSVTNGLDASLINGNNRIHT